MTFFHWLMTSWWRNMSDIFYILSIPEMLYYHAITLMSSLDTLVKWYNVPNFGVNNFGRSPIFPLLSLPRKCIHCTHCWLRQITLQQDGSIGNSSSSDYFHRLRIMRNSHYSLMAYMIYQNNEVFDLFVSGTNVKSPVGQTLLLSFFSIILLMAITYYYYYHIIHTKIYRTWKKKYYINSFVC